MPNQGFRRRASITTIPSAGLVDPYQALRGQVESDYFGDAEAALSGATLYLLNLPGEHWGAGNVSHWSHIERGGEKSLASVVRLNSQDLSGGGWRINLQELPEEHRNPGVATHTCVIWRQDGSTFTGDDLKGLLEDDLRPFLSLMFGQHIQFSMLEGRSSSENGPITPWGTIFPYSPEREPLPVGNWFTRTATPMDLPSLFDTFCGLPNDIKRHFHKVIRKYITSEMLGHMGRAELFEEAASISFAGLEGLTRSIISTYPCKDKWLRRNLRLRQGKHISPVIEMVIKKELGGLVDQDTLVSALASIRNATAHTDLGPDNSDYTKVVLRWQQCQFLVEAVVLARLGLKTIRNRTSPGTFRIMGRDMFSSVRPYEVQFETNAGNQDGESAQ